ncbi:GAP family protein [Actinomycetospora cinnamomea]|uniref:Sap-like sulfolipid-1-addressing protein n=1 Tax=Actinomycetospora cinnamomea TaxID=663609 RepID=A0A2U1FQA5_9PSEU|nr:GAP family protein [Actinomycetospora cinnamomea]PVZ14357.1 Sap-like sulfolipid-1-addressing protein [Actinomycetospora cinnamomea]
MSAEALALGVLSAVRGVPLAIVYALLLSPHPARLLLTYVAAGLAVTLGVGIVVVTWLHTDTRSSGATTGHLGLDLALGAVAVAWAGLRLAGRDPLRRRARPSAEGRGVLPAALDRRLRAPTVPTVAAAGVATNLPGLYFLAALVAILQTHPSAVGGIVQVLVYGLLRFALPAAALALVVLRPDHTREVVRAAHAWGTRHARVLGAVLVGGVGVYLVAKGLVGLLG